MKALTVQQPWAWAIIHGGKDVENRTQAWSYRGPLAIHAGARWSDRGLTSPLVQKAAIDVDPDHPVVYPFNHQVWKAVDSLPLGAIIGVVDLVDVHEAVPEGDGPVTNAACCRSPWAEQEWHGKRHLVHLVLANPRPLEQPIPYRGALGLWTLPDDVLNQMQAVAS